MSKAEKKPADAISLASLCDTRASELRESLPSIAELFTDAATMLRQQHEALAGAKCQHMMTFTVTKEMNQTGRDLRAPGKYCMTCGELIPKPPKPPKEPAETRVEECMGSYNNGSSACMKPAGHDGECGPPLGPLAQES